MPCLSAPRQHNATVMGNLRNLSILSKEDTSVPSSTPTCCHDDEFLIPRVSQPKQKGRMAAPCIHRPCPAMTPNMESSTCTANAPHAAQRLTLLLGWQKQQTHKEARLQPKHLGRKLEATPTVMRRHLLTRAQTCGSISCTAKVLHET